MTGKTDGSIAGLTMSRLTTLALVLVGAVTLAACSDGGSDGGSTTSSTPPVAGSRPSAVTVPTQTPNSGRQAASTPTGAATRARFTVGDTEIMVRIADNPTSRDFVSMLPLTLDFRDFNATEKISFLSRRLTTQGSPGSAPANRDLIYYVPWGNLGFFYNAPGGYSDQVIMIGTVETGYERLDDLETGPVSVELVP